MKATDISPSETNQQQPNLNPPINSQKIENNNSSLNPIDISKSDIEMHQSELINNKNGSKNKTHLGEKTKLSTGAPFKSLIKEEDLIIPDSNIFNNSLNNIPSNPFLNKDLNKSNNSNQQDVNKKKPENNMKKNRTQFIRNSINVIPQPESKIITNTNKGIIRIKLFKSQIKPRRPNPYECEKIDNNSIFEPNTQFKVGSNNNDKVSAVSDFGDKNIQYKLLIKRIADKLKRKSKKPTRGYFYVSIIRTDKYLNKVKNIAKKMKKQVCPPTHGFFYAYIEKEKQYKLLIKRIALLLKKRIKFPTCKIIKVYESYRILIKRIANILKKSMIKKSNLDLQNNKTNINVEKRDEAIEVEDNNEINIAKSIDIPNDINNNNSNEIIPKEENSINAKNNNNNAQNDEENKMDLDIEMKDIQPEAEKKEASEQEIHQNEKEKEKEEKKEEEVKIDIEKNELKQKIDKKEEESKKNCPNVVGNNTGIKMEENIQTNFTPLTYNKDSKSKLAQNIINDNINIASSNYSFSKMDIVQTEFPKSAEPKPLNSINENNDKINLEQIEQFDKIEQNVKGPTLPKENKVDNNNQEQKEKSIQDKPMEIKSNHNSQKSAHEPTEIIKKENEDIPLRACQIIRNSKYTKTLTSFSKRNKSIRISIPIFQKEKIVLNEMDERKIHNRTHTKNDINLNLDNFRNFYKKIEEHNANDNLTLSDIEVSKSNFINNFKKFLDQEKIEIINNFPVSLNEKHKIYFYQSNFWYLIITYLFYQSNNLSLYEIIHLLEQYNIWSKDKNEEIYSSIKEKIEEYIKKNYSNEIIEQFLFMNKLSGINQIFQKYEICGNNNNKNNQLYEYKEIKIDNINIINDKPNSKCKCDLCTNDDSCIQKVCDLNKSRIHIVNNPDIELDALTPEQQYQNLIKKCNNNNMLHINEALFYEGIPQKKQNNCFSKSKTIFEEKTNIEYNYLPTLKEKMEEKVNTHTHDNTNDINVNNHNDNIKGNDNDKDKDNLIDENIDIENGAISNGNNLMNNKNVTDGIDTSNQNLEEIIENGGKTKSFKKVSKFKKEEVKEKEKENENIVDSEKVTKSEKYTNSNSAQSERSDKLDEIESADEDKNRKKEKKAKKIKSRKNNKKKKDTTKNKNEKDVEENGEDEKNGKEKEKIENDKKEEEKSNKKRKKTGNGMKKSNNNNKSFEKNDDEKNELKKMLEEDTTEIKKEDENFDNNSKRKKSKSKSPNKKKNRKH